MLENFDRRSGAEKKAMEKDLVLQEKKSFKNGEAVPSAKRALENDDAFLAFIGELGRLKGEILKMKGDNPAEYEKAKTEYDRVKSSLLSAQIELELNPNESVKVDAALSAMGKAALVLGSGIVLSSMAVVTGGLGNILATLVMGFGGWQIGRDIPDAIEKSEMLERLRKINRIL